MQASPAPPQIGLDLSTHPEHPNVVATELRNNLGKQALTIIVFGGSGHLAKTKTFPGTLPIFITITRIYLPFFLFVCLVFFLALFELFENDVLPDTTRIIGYARSQMKEEEFRKQITSGLPSNAKTDAFIKLCSYFTVIQQTLLFVSNYTHTHTQKKIQKKREKVTEMMSHMLNFQNTLEILKVKSVKTVQTDFVILQSLPRFLQTYRGVFQSICSRKMVTFCFALLCFVS